MIFAMFVTVSDKNCWQKFVLFFAIFSILGFPAWAQQKVLARDKEHLQKLVAQGIRESGLSANLNYIDTSQVKNMSELFYGSLFNGDISGWDVSNV